MLLSALSLTFVLAAQFAKGQNSCPLHGTTAPSVDGTNNYVTDYFNSLLLFTYAIDKCTATALVSTNTWFKYACIKNGDAWKVTKTQYNDDQCSTTGTEVESWNQGDVPEGYPGYFLCSGLNSYVKVEVSPSTTCASTQTIYAGLGGCTFNSLSGNSISTRFYCDSDKALVEVFLTQYPSARRMLAATTGIESSSTYMESSSTYMEASSSYLEASSSYLESSSSYLESSEVESSEIESSEIESSEIESSTSSPGTTSVATTGAPLLCDSNLYCSAWTFGSSCKKILTFVPPGSSGVDIYGRLDECTILTTEQTTVVDNNNNNKKSASSLFVITNLAVAIVVALFSLF